MNSRTHHGCKVLCSTLFLATLGFAMNSNSFAAPTTTAPTTTAPSAIAIADSIPNPRQQALQKVVDEVARIVLERFKEQKLNEEQLSISLLDMSGAEDLGYPLASFRGNARTYPASVVKLFYLAAIERWLEDKNLTDTPELRRAMKDMIVDSSNDATSLVVDALTGVSSGPEMEGEAWTEWKEKRNAVNRFFAAMGYANQNINQKPWNEGPYGRERQFVGANYNNRNALTTEATVRLMQEIMLDRWVSPARSQAMQKLLRRQPEPKPQPESQIDGFIGTALKTIPGAKLWSKAGWTSTTRHDVACVELPVSPAHPRGAHFILAVFTSGHANNLEILPTVTREVIARLSAAR